MEIADRQALPLSVPDCVDGMAAAQSAARRQASSPLHPHQGYVIIGVTYIYRANPTYWQIRPARLEPAERPLNNIEKGQEARAMKVLGIVDVISAFGFFGAGPAIGHDCHHDHHWSDCWDCGHYARQSPMPSRGMAVPGGTVALQTIVCFR